MRYFCSYFDRHYSPYGLALYRSLVRHVPEFELYVLCYDDATVSMMNRLGDHRLHPVHIGELERQDPALVQAKQGRTRVEGYFTAGPSWIRYAIERSGAELMTYLDSDLYFFSDPGPIFDEIGTGSILIVGHRFPEALKHMEKSGIYNVGLVAFRNNEEGRRCLDSWRAQCLEWCYNRVEHDRFADQKYLDQWPSRFSGVVVLQHPGAGLAPWNVARYRLELNSQCTVDGFPLIFFHFTMLYRIRRGLYYLSLDDYGAVLTEVLKRYIYAPYIREVEEVAREIAHVEPGRKYTWRDFLHLVRRRKQVVLVSGSTLQAINLSPLSLPLSLLKSLLRRK